MNIPSLEKAWKLAGIALVVWLAIPLVYFGLKFISSLWGVMVMGVAIGV